MFHARILFGKSDCERMWEDHKRRERRENARFEATIGVDSTNPHIDNDHSRSVNPRIDNDHLKSLYKPSHPLWRIFRQTI